MVNLNEENVLFQALLLCRLPEDEISVASLFQLFEPSGLSSLPPVRGPRQEGESVQGVHEERGVIRIKRNGIFFNSFTLMRTKKQVQFPFYIDSFLPLRSITLKFHNT